MPRKRTLLKVAAAALAAALLLPFLVNVNRFRGQIARALEAGLGRPVQVGNVRLKLLSGPGFHLENVTIAEDPAFGIEPFARMPSLRATLRLRSLWTGRMSFSSLLFVEPSVNLARNEQNRWNLEPLLARAGNRSRFLAAPPYIGLQDARINFKSGDTKSVFFLSDVDGALYSSADGPRRLRLRLTGSPARTDRTLTDVGQVRIEGSFGPAPAGLRLQVDLTNAYLADLLVLASGADRGIHGVLDVKTVLEGEPAALRSTGTARLRDLHRWDMLPPQGGSSFELQFEALLNGPQRLLQVQKAQVALEAGTLEGSGSVSHLLSHPAYQFRVRFSGVSAERVLGTLRDFSSRWSRSLRAEGMFRGELLVQGPPALAEGWVAARDLTFQDAGQEQVRAGEARLNVQGTTVRLQPTALEVGRGRTLNVAATWNWNTGGGEFSAAGRDLLLRNVSSLLPALPFLLPLPGAHSLAQSAPPATEGTLTLNLRGQLARDAPPHLTGWGQLARVRWTPSRFNAPILLHTARLDFLADQVRASRIVASWGGATITGALRLPPLASTAVASRSQPPIYNADLRVDEIDSAALAAALRPSDGRGLPALLLAPARGGGEQGEARQDSAHPDAPPFRAEGRLSVGRLRLRRLEVSALETAFHLTGRRLQLEQARGAFAGGVWTGSALLDFSAAPPAYQVNGRVRDVALDTLAALSERLEDVAAGQASGSVMLSTSGWNVSELMNNLSMRLRLQGRDLLLRNIDLEAAAGGQASADGAAAGGAAGKGVSRIQTFTADLAVERRRVRLQHVRLATLSAAFQATGSVEFDRTADIRVLPVGVPEANRTPLNSFRLVGPLELPRALSLEEERRTPGAS